MVDNFTIQYNTLSLQSQTDRCENDILKYNSITDNCHAGQYCGKYCDIVTTGSILEMEEYYI